MSDAEILANPNDALFRESLRIAERREQLRQQVTNKEYAEFKGTVTEVSSRGISVKAADGSTKTVPMTAKRAQTLLKTSK